MLGELLAALVVLVAPLAAERVQFRTEPPWKHRRTRVMLRTIGGVVHGSVLDPDTITDRVANRHGPGERGAVFQRYRGGWRNMSTPFDRSELQELLQKPIAEKVGYFGKKRIAHPTLLSVRDRQCSTNKLRAGVDLAIVTGPTGVGKSTLINIFRDQVEQGQIDYLRSDPGCVPVVVVEAPAPEAPTAEVPAKKRAPRKKKTED